MPVTHHVDLEVVAGDDWVIDGTLLNADGSTTDLSTANAVYWTLLGPDGYPILSTNQATVAIVDPPSSGTVRISVSSSVTSGLDPGRYTDAIRVVGASLTAMFWIGQILVDADPWSTAS
jgi:hypothetical protein